MADQTILGILRDFDLSLYAPLHQRSLSLGAPLPPRAGNLVKVISGMRRSGKSYRLFQEMRALIEDGISPDRICYFNFEDDRLMPVTPQTGDAVLEAFQALHPHAFEEVPSRRGRTSSSTSFRRWRDGAGGFAGSWTRIAPPST